MIINLSDRRGNACIFCQITSNYNLHKQVGGHIKSDNLQLPCVQPPASLCATSKFLTNLIIIHHGRDGYHGRDVEDGRGGHHGCHGHGHQALHVDHSRQSHHG